MMLHCASRLGLISYLHSNRHEIAYTIGLITEIPIATCNGEYFAKQAPLIIEDDDSADQQLPVQFSIAREILLFSHETALNLSMSLSELLLTHNTSFVEVQYSPPVIRIFHPPCEG
ncbi:MAG TPA: hypothetical protein VK616_12115 [Flavitalea sp.]|nr:hypothetical protein [Flavitalea sp.]